jgi:transcriptional regulator with XRE-family HTH domain
VLARQYLAANLRKRRLAVGWSQEELADRTGIHRTYISGLERAGRNPSLNVLERIASALHIQVHELLEPAR